jgi:signal peptide peptidase SppA
MSDDRLIVNPMKTFGADLEREPWAMEERALNTFVQQVALLRNSPVPQAGRLADIFGKRPENQAMVVDGKGIARIQVRGVLMKSVSWIYRLFEITATGYDEIGADVAEALENPDVKGILLHIESPGGQVPGTAELGEQIRAARKTKPVNAFIEDLGASGAYWLASQATEISATTNAMVGSIGVYMVFLDLSEMAKQQGIEVKVIRSGEHKGMGIAGAPITEAQEKGVQKIIDGMADNFVTAVSKGREKSKAEVQAWATGQAWIAKEAKGLGLVDRVQDINAALARFRPATTTNRGGKTMADLNAAPDPKALESARAEAQAAERKRAADIKAAFSEDPEFALAQIEAGSSVVEAKGAYAEVLQERLATQGKELETLKKGKGTPTPDPKKKVRGVDPVEDAGLDEGGGGTFMEQAQAMKEEKGISIREAMSKICRMDPDLYQAHKEAEEEAPRRPRR